jgi:tetratricopeptide (TPR) repeat protein
MEFLKKSREAMDKSQPQQARKCLTQALHEDDKNAMACMALGAMEYDEGRYYEAACAFHRAARLEPTRYEPHFNIGLVMESAGLYSKAIPAYESALKLSPDQVEVMEHLARCYIKTHTNLEKARGLIDKASAAECRAEWVRWLEQQSRKLENEPSSGQARKATADEQQSGATR